MQYVHAYINLRIHTFFWSLYYAQKHNTETGHTQYPAQVISETEKKEGKHQQVCIVFSQFLDINDHHTTH